MEVNYKNKKYYNTAKYPIRQPKIMTFLLYIVSKIALNKIQGIRAGVLESVNGIELARSKNNINVLSFGADNISVGKAIKIRVIKFCCEHRIHDVSPDFWIR